MRLQMISSWLASLGCKACRPIRNAIRERCRHGRDRWNGSMEGVRGSESSELLIPFESACQHVSIAPIALRAFHNLYMMIPMVSYYSRLQLVLAPLHPKETSIDSLPRKDWGLDSANGTT